MEFSYTSPTYRLTAVLDSKELQMSGHKLSSSTTPTELDAFIDSMDRALETQKDWRRLLLVCVPVYSANTTSTKTTTVVKEILHNFCTIPPKELTDTDFHCTDSLHDASLAMYDVISMSMILSFRGEMHLYRNKINNQGPKLLYFILKKLTQKDSRTVADFQLSLTTLEKAFKESGYDIHMACPVIFDRLQQYKCAGGNPDTHYSMISNILLSMNCDALTSNVREWEQEQMRNNNVKCIFDLLQSLPIYVSSLITNGSWPHKSSSTSKDFGTQFKALQVSTDTTETSAVSKSDLTAFKAQIELLIQKSQSKAANIACKAMIAHNKLSSNKSNNTTIILPKKKRMTHRFASDKWGPDLFYKIKEAFAEFYNATISRMDLTAKYNYVGLTWEHCAKCKRI